MSSQEQQINEQMAYEFGKLTEKKKQVFAEIRVNSPLNGLQPIFALLGYDDLRTLEGKLLTIVDASFSDPAQRKAVKDLVRQSIWWQWVPHLDQHPDSSGSAGMPVE